MSSMYLPEFGIWNLLRDFCGPGTGFCLGCEIGGRPDPGLEKRHLTLAEAIWGGRLSQAAGPSLSNIQPQVVRLLAEADYAHRLAIGRCAAVLCLKQNEELRSGGKPDIESQNLDE